MMPHIGWKPLGLALVLASAALNNPAQAGRRMLGEWFGPASAPLAESNTPHPSVARIVVPETDGTAYGSGTLVDCREQFGLVVTNWHVVRDSAGPIEAVFPDGFRSQARAVRLDKQWDLAALVIWRPPAKPVPLARQAPQSGDVLTIAGYGRGQYRQISGRCTQYYAPRHGLPLDFVELDVEARQGDSGGPILNDRGELAGVLFGAGEGTTLGSFEGRVKSFLATVAPDIGMPRTELPAIAATPPRPTAELPRALPSIAAAAPTPSVPVQTVQPASARLAAVRATPNHNPPQRPDSGTSPASDSAAVPEVPETSSVPAPLLGNGRNLLAIVGLVAAGMQLLKLAA